MKKACLALFDPGMESKLAHDLLGLGYEVTFFRADQITPFVLPHIITQGQLILVSYHPLLPEKIKHELGQLFNNPTNPLIIVSTAGSPAGIDFLESAPFHIIPTDYTLRELELCVTAVSRIAQSARSSQEMFKTMIEHSVDGVVLLNRMGQILYLNPAILKIFDETNDDDLHLFNVQDFVTPEYKETVRSNIEKVFATGNGDLLELRAKTLSGKILWVEMHGTLIPYNGEMVELISLKDITHRKQAQELHLQSEEKYRKLIESSHEAVVFLQNGNIVFSNRKAYTLLGYPMEEMIGKPLGKFIHPSELARVTSIHTRRSSGEAAPTFYETKIINFKGRTIEVDFNIAITSYLGQPTTVVFIRDLTQRKYAQRSVQYSQESYRGLFHNTSDAILIQDPFGVILDANRAAIRTFGFNREDLLGATIEIVSAPHRNCAERVQVAIQEAFDGKPQLFEWWGQRSNSEVFPLEILMNRGKLFGLDVIFVVARDITDRKRIEEEIRMLAHATRSVNDSIVIFDTDEKIVFVNPAFCQMYGYNQSEIIGKPISTIRSADKSNELGIQTYTQSLRNGWRGELMDMRKDGTVFPVHLSSSVVKNEEGTPTHFIGIITDITERRKQETELVEAKNRAEESDKLKSAFLSNMSHEIRSPMHAILGFLRLLSEENLSEVGKQYVEHINSSSHQLLCLIDDIIDVSKIQANQLRLKSKVFDLNSMLNGLYAQYSTQINLLNGENLSILPPILSKPTPYIVLTDELRLRQVLTNLIGNAVKFTPRGTIEFGYEFTRTQDSEQILFFVKDTGIGVDSEKQKYIFDRFRQADDSYTRMFGGAGLGLSISKGIVELLGGKIWVESTEGVGTQFYFTIYLEPSLPPRLKFSNDAETSTNTLCTAHWNSYTLMVVEDIPEARYLLNKLLARTGAQIHFASNGQEARSLFRELNRIDLVLLDIRLPDTDGYILAREFKAQNANVPIIAQTAFAMNEDRERCLVSGCDDFITKPIDPETLIRKANVLMAKQNSNGS